MFGNRLGWGISAFFVLITVLFLWLVHRKGTVPQSPTAIGQNAATYTLQMPIGPRSLATFMTEPGDAIELYKEAIAEYQKHETVLSAPQLNDMQTALDLLVRASKMAKPGVFTDRPKELITYDPDRPALKALRGLGTLALQQARIYKSQNQPAKEKELYQAMFALGLKLHEERLVWEEWKAGRELMAASIYLAQMAETPEQARLLADFDAQWAPFYRNNIEKVQLAVLVPEPYTGDMAALAIDCPEPMWRVEAALALGRCKYSGQTLGDQIGAKRLLVKLVGDADPRVGLAAELARDLAIEQWRMLR